MPSRHFLLFLEIGQDKYRYYFGNNEFSSGQYPYHDRYRLGLRVIKSLYSSRLHLLLMLEQTYKAQKIQLGESKQQAWRVGKRWRGWGGGVPGRRQVENGQRDRRRGSRCVRSGSDLCQILTLLSEQAGVAHYHSGLLGLWRCPKSEYTHRGCCNLTLGQVRSLPSPRKCNSSFYNLRWIQHSHTSTARIATAT